MTGIVDNYSCLSFGDRIINWNRKSDSIFLNLSTFVDFFGEKTTRLLSTSPIEGVEIVSETGNFELEEFKRLLNFERNELNIVNLHTFYLSARITLNPAKNQKRIKARSF